MKIVFFDTKEFESKDGKPSPFDDTVVKRKLIVMLNAIRSRYGYHFERVMNGMANATGESFMGYTGIGRNGEPVTPLNAAINMLGLKVNNVDFQREYSFKISDIERENCEILVKIRSLSRQMKQGSIIPLEAQTEIREQKQKIHDNAARAKEFTRLNKDRKQLSTDED